MLVFELSKSYGRRFGSASPRGIKNSLRIGMFGDIAWPHSASTQECQPIFNGMDLYRRGYRFPPRYVRRCVRVSRTSVRTVFQFYIPRLSDTRNRICVAAKCIPSSQALAVVYNTRSINDPRHEPSPRHCRVESTPNEQAGYFSTEKVGEGRRMHNPFTTQCHTHKIVLSQTDD